MNFSYLNSNLCVHGFAIRIEIFVTKTKWFLHSQYWFVIFSDVQKIILETKNVVNQLLQLMNLSSELNSTLSSILTNVTQDCNVTHCNIRTSDYNVEVNFTQFLVRFIQHYISNAVSWLLILMKFLKIIVVQSFEIENNIIPFKIHIIMM